MPQVHSDSLDSTAGEALSAAPLLCIGHSHIHAVKAAAEGDGLRIDSIPFWFEPGALPRDDQGRLAFRPDLLERIRVVRPVVSFVGGAAHSVVGAVEHPRPFDFILPSDPELPFDATRELIPADAVRAALVTADAEFGEIFRLLLVSAGGPVTQVEAPPPVPDSERLRAHTPWSFFPGQPQEIAPKWLRYKLWRLHSEIVAERCAALNVAYVRVPRAAMDAEGFLRAGLDADGYHGGPEYGRMVLQSLGVVR